MKTFVIFITIFSVSLTTCAQNPKALLTELGLKGPVKKIIEYKYSTDTSKINIDTSKKILKTIIEFDENGNETEELMYNIDRKGQQSKFSFKYKKDSTIVKTQFDDRGKLFCTYVFKYDGQGRKIVFDTKSEKYKRQGYLSMSPSEGMTTYKYDEKGNLIEDDQYNVSLKKYVFKNKYLYDEKNQKIEMDGYRDEEILDSKTIFKYDTVGRAIEMSSYDRDNKFMGGGSTEYVATDQYGNWTMIRTQPLHSANNQYKYFTERIISYY